MLAGKVALVTGAGKNIGRAIALTLARDGAKVVVNGRSDAAAIEAVAAEIRAAGGQAEAVLADVSDPDAVARLVAQAGPVDILVCNAGLRRQTPFLEMSLAEWREILSVALDGAFILSRAVLPRMVAPRRRVDRRAVRHLDACRHAEPRACLGLEGRAGGADARHRGGVRAAGHPRELRRTRRGGHHARRQRRRHAAGARPEDGIPMRRKATIEEIASVVRMLAGPEGGYVTGQTIHVNGGAFLA